MKIQEQATEEREAAEAFRIEELEANQARVNDSMNRIVENQRVSGMTRMFEHFGRTGEVKTELDEDDFTDFQARSAGYVPNGEVVTIAGSQWRVESRLVPDAGSPAVSLPPYRKGEPNILTVERERRGERLCRADARD